MPATTHSPIHERRRLGVALALYLALVVAIITLVPFRLVWPTELRLVGFRTVSDLVSNVVLFVPLGFFVAFAGRGRPAAVAFALSLAVELLQEAMPSRSPSAFDLVTNTLGGAVGGAAYRSVAGALGARRSRGVFALDLPLLGIVYLTVPLLWLSGLVSAGDPDRRWLAALLPTAGIPVFAAVARHHLAARGRPAVIAGLLAGGWAMVGLVPGWYRQPGFLLLLTGFIAIGAAVAAALTRSLPPGHGRYEVPTLRRAGVALGLYLGLAALWPLDRLGTGWRAALALGPEPGAGTVWAILQLVELVAGATLAGYLLAELRSRAAEGSRWAQARSALPGALLGLVLIGARGFHSMHRATLAEAVFVVLGAVSGGRMYHLQRDYVLAVLAEYRGHGPATGAAPVRKPATGDAIGEVSMQAR